jgi:hypothetical protein
MTSLYFSRAGQVYERRLIEKYIQENGRDPISKVRKRDAPKTDFA